MSDNKLRRENHYVPIWYQKGFSQNQSTLIHYLDLDDREINTPKGKITVKSRPKKESMKNTFCIRDLYSTFLSGFISDEIEDKLFGEIDIKGSRAVKAFIKNEPTYMHQRFFDFFQFIDIQKLRTPKGLDWINNKYSGLNHNELLLEMQTLMKMNIALWTEGVREIVSAKDSNVKFILSDHPVTTYNYSISPKDIASKYPYEPPIPLKATQTIFPLNMNECLILTNFEYADKPNTVDPKEKRTNPNYFRESLTNTMNMIRERKLRDNDVKKINYIIKKRAKKYIAAGKREWLYPDKDIEYNWQDFQSLLLPPKEKIGIFGGELYIGYENGKHEYQDAFGRKNPEIKFLQKSIDENKIKANDPCGCGSALKYKDCCKNKEKKKRSSWKELSIRERNIILSNGILDILGLTKGKNWDDIRRELTPTQVKEIHELYNYLWPLDTDIISLLPKKDNTLRVLYTGIVDTFTVDSLILSLTLYFDQIIIQNPIVHPSKMKEDFNPIQHPEKYLQQTLKYSYLIIKLSPYIESGLINLIPDPGAFNEHLSLNSLNLSKERYLQKGKREDFKDEITKQSMEIHQNRMFLGLSKEQAVSIFKDKNPKITEKELELLLTEYKKISASDPLVLLQEKLLDKSDQIQLLNLSPILEMSLFICQVTGSILITHSNVRWEEIKEAQFKNYGMPIYNHQKLTNFINNFDFTISQNTEFIYKNRNKKSLIRLRALLSEVNDFILSDSQGTNKNFIKNFKSKFLKNNRKYIQELKVEDEGKNHCNFEFLIPYNGIINKKVQRLIAQNTCEQYEMNVPMAIFLSI